MRHQNKKKHFFFNVHTFRFRIYNIDIPENPEIHRHQKQKKKKVNNSNSTNNNMLLKYYKLLAFFVANFCF